ncbi:MAG: hypothetical protein K2X77_29230 [Candidatus Obscuribacterales bacterium]|jgi:hypothetical protein|nr:hypothetical protein [Candidatus Obscuribacterales bacterium]
MGFSLSWLAVKNVPESTLLTKIGAQKTGKNSEVPDWKLSYFDRGKEWHWLVENNVDMMRDKKDLLITLSKGTELICVVVEEHVMYSAASEWKDGVRVWLIEHDNERGGLQDIRAEGTVPDCYQETRTDLLKQLMSDPETDYLFDVPTTVAMKICGYKHDEVPDTDDVYWELKYTRGK